MDEQDKPVARFDPKLMYQLPDGSWTHPPVHVWPMRFTGSATAEALRLPATVTTSAGGSDVKG